MDVNSKIGQTINAKYLILKVYCWKVESTTEWQTSVIKQEISYSNLDMVQNLESPRLSRRVDSTAPCENFRLNS